MSNFLNTIEEAIRKKNYYRAQQLYISLAFRFKSKGETEQAINLLSSGSIKLIQNGEYLGGIALGFKMIEILISEKIKPDENRIKLIENIVDCFPEKEKTQATSFIEHAIDKWTTTKENILGDANLHYITAKIYENNEDYGESQKHYIQTKGRTKEFGKMLITWAKQGTKSEIDLFIARPILQMLCFSNLDDSESLYEYYIQELVSNMMNIQTPLLNFITFLFRTLRRDSKELFLMLREKYLPSLQRDPSFVKFVDQIGRVYFDIETPRQDFASLFGNLIPSLLGDSEEKK
ncbi:golgi to er traffic protein [Anaeramoeba ignava]|uniref:Golgi to er traffic protein n=1 Tax=Anaeramoeba ignava TaxID=1746090 RepID=A0A9Q0LKJ0_ANAIG|nr:golgi to er traffic protein [Anaeramoeba ignava]|eukprot:Anaeramoba_ignava/a348717_38.p1 GENE.a348717_38~~a348717_38.p1  ORF type:complete len:291 (-),score=109.16 a348717_38:90-962(-)